LSTTHTLIEAVPYSAERMVLSSDSRIRDVSTNNEVEREERILSTRRFVGAAYQTLLSGPQVGLKELWKVRSDSLISGSPSSIFDLLV
jgi:hypothetical protein